MTSVRAASRTRQRSRAGGDAATEAGFDEHVVKPVTAAMLRKIIAERAQ